MRNKLQLMKAGFGRYAEPDGHLFCSRFNHPRVPNADVVESPSRRSNYAPEIDAARPTARGEEITINHLTTHIHRSAGTWDCPACNMSDPFHSISDMRRALPRGLDYLLNGIDAPGCAGRNTREAEKEKRTARNRIRSKEVRKTSKNWSRGVCSRKQQL